MKYLSYLLSLVAYLCIATVAAQMIGVTVLLARGWITQERLGQCAAILYGIDVEGMREQLESDAAVENATVDYNEIVEARLEESLDLDLRETAIDKGLLDLRALENQLKNERARYDKLKTSFDDRLAKLEQVETDAALQALQRTLEAMRPEQAKEQILRMLEAGDATPDDDVMHDIVTVLKAMTTDKRKKILAEFKTEEEADKLNEILRQIRLGVPEVALIRDTRDKLASFGSLRP